MSKIKKEKTIRKVIWEFEVVFFPPGKESYVKGVFVEATHRTLALEIIYAEVGLERVHYARHATSKMIDLIREKNIPVLK